MKATRRNTSWGHPPSTATVPIKFDDYARSRITAAGLGERVRRRYNISNRGECHPHGSFG